MKTIKYKRKQKKQKVQISKISKISKKINKDKANLDLRELLNKAEKITLDDLDFNKILKEQKQVLCDIQKMFHIKQGITQDETVKCNIKNLKKDENIKEIIEEYKQGQLENKGNLGKIHMLSKKHIKHYQSHKTQKSK